MKPEDIVARLTPFLERETGGPVQVANVRTLTGGATREAWSLDVTIRESGAPRELGLVLLIFRPGGQRAFTAADGSAFTVVWATAPEVTLDTTGMQVCRLDGTCAEGTADLLVSAQPVLVRRG